MAEKKVETADEARDAEQHPDYPGLTRGEVKAAQAKARAKVEAARKKAQLAKLEETETQRLMLDEGVDGSEEIVELVLDLPLDMPWIATDGKRWFNGQTIRVRRSVACDLLHRAYAGHRNEAARRGVDSFAFYQQHRAPRITHVGGSNVAVIPNGAAQ